ncbi:MAG: LLM class flavin-dependent oxidoreductase [Gammaproteobacteria bacterium]|nr:LLM class flavin-dependent oxidoreductase [Gammaproteobacteria bacterium]
MQFGMFMEFQSRPGTTEADAFREGFDLVDAAEAWGLDSVWLAEFHFVPKRSVLSSPIVIAGAIAARTQRLRIGMAVYVLPLNNPLRIAEEAATIDQISGGRLDFGIGRSGFTFVYNSYGIPFEQSQRRFDESLAILTEAWKGETFSYDGEFYQINNATLVPRPLQRPHPPLRIAATTDETYPRVGAQGLPIFVGLRGDGTGELRRNLESYRAAWREAGHAGDGSAYLRVPLYAGSTERAAIEDARETLTYYFDRQAKLVAADAARRTVGADRKQRTADRLADLSYDRILATRAAVGGPRGLTERLQQVIEELNLDGIVAELNPGGLLTPEQVRANLEVLTHEVMPAFKQP